MSVWSSFEFTRWLDADMPAENYKDANGSIINPSRDVVYMYLESKVSFQDAHFIANLQALEYLKMSLYDGTSLPFNFMMLQELIFLSISPASETSSLEVFPTAICQLKNLQDLKLSGHRFQHLDSLLYIAYDLHTLDLSNNRIVEVPTTLSRLKHLQRLNLSGNISVNIEPILEIDSLRFLDVTDTVVTGFATKLPSALTHFLFGKSSDSFPESLLYLWNTREEVNYTTFHVNVIKKLQQEAYQIMDEELENTN